MKEKLFPNADLNHQHCFKGLVNCYCYVCIVYCLCIVASSLVMRNAP